MEKSLEDQCRSYAAGLENTAPGKVLAHCATSASQLQQSLSERLELLGAAPALGSGLLGQLFSFRLPGQNDAEPDAPAYEKLVAVFAAENGGIAFHEVLAIMSEAASDEDTETLARSIQQTKKERAEEIWHLFSDLAR